MASDIRIHSMVMAAMVTMDTAITTTMGTTIMDLTTSTSQMAALLMTTLPVDNTTIENRTRPPLVLNYTPFATVNSEIVGSTRPESHPWPGTSPWPLVLHGDDARCVIGYLILTGVGVWGNNNPVMWGFPIVNFVFSASATPGR